MRAILLHEVPVFRDITAISRGINFSRFFSKVPPVFFHLLFWISFITYEVSLALSISKKLGHPLDYTLHYALCIGLVYFHCFYVLNCTISGERKNWYGLFFRLLTEIIVFFICGAFISLSLDLLKIERTWNFRDSNFVYGNLYRCVYMLAISTSYWTVLHLFRKQKRIHRMERSKLLAEMAWEKQKIYSEMALVKATINPHMLSNCLNIIYNRVRKGDKAAADLILKLTELMHFSLTDTSEDGKLNLQEELDYIGHYIHFYKQRISSNIIFLTEGQPGDFQQRVIPFLLATLVENMFQHGDLSEPKNPASITICCKNGLLEISTANKVSLRPSKGHGIGLVNMQKRLHYVYPGAYLFDAQVKGDIYKTSLKINLNNPA